MRLPANHLSTLHAAAATVVFTASLAVVTPGAAQADPGDWTAKVIIQNETSEDFSLSWYDVYEGQSDIRPAETIAADDWDWLRSESTADQAGTSGAVSYTTDSGDAVTIYWNNPWEDDNVFSCDVPDHLSCTWDDNGEPHTEVTFTITD